MISTKKKGKSRLTPYGIQLREKQKARFYYGITEKQMSNYFNRASRSLGNSGEIFMQLLETRLDNVVYRLGWASSHQKARQLVNHGHIIVDGKKVTIPSYRVKAGQSIGVRQASQPGKMFQEVMPVLEKVQVPGWIHSEKKSLEGKVVGMPTLTEVNPLYDVRLITEYYSR